MKSFSFVKLLVCCSLVGLLLSCASVPRHPNLVDAEHFVQQAIDKVTDAQNANNFDMKGHAARAKELMRQAIEEIKLAEQAADRH
jgi:outer membrane biogenesis lipoprotein LolB